jgi:catechol 2,3-dioxygenase-like lactoylglutathione lyase family enzyme
MFEGIQHIGYWVDDLDKATAWFECVFGGRKSGGGAMPDSRIVPGGGRNAFVRFGAAEVELMQPADIAGLPADTLVMHHVGYIVSDIGKAADAARAKGLRFLADAPFTNVVGQEVLYFDPDTTNGLWMHLTKVPAAAPVAATAGPRIEGILHPGILVGNADEAAAWYAEKLGGVVVGGGPSRRGGRVAFVACGGAQVELIEPPDAGALGAAHALDHVGYVAGSLDADIDACKALGLRFQTEEVLLNPIGQRLIYFDTACSLGTRMHLTALPA